jgi:hypothetical protein
MPTFGVVGYAGSGPDRFYSGADLSGRKTVRAAAAMPTPASRSVQEAGKFYQEEMPKQGWRANPNNKVVAPETSSTHQRPVPTKKPTTTRMPRPPTPTATPDRGPIARRDSHHA